MSLNRTINHGPDAGFTLLELLAVFTLLALVAAVTVPRLGQTTSRMAFRGAVLAVASDLKIARAEALRTNSSQAIRLTGRSWTDSTGRARALPDGVRVSMAGQTASRIRFDPDGTSSGGTVHLTAPDRSAAIKADPVTGAIRITWR